MQNVVKYPTTNHLASGCVTNTMNKTISTMNKKAPNTSPIPIAAKSNATIIKILNKVRITN